jgi:hypothetical protein
MPRGSGRATSRSYGSSAVASVYEADGFVTLHDHIRPHSSTTR